MRWVSVSRGINKPLLVELISTLAELFGLVMPIPTIPEVVIRILSASLVISLRLIALVVPSFEVLVALLLPARLQKGDVF